MTFSEFADKLYKIMGKGSSQSAFARTLFESIISEDGLAITDKYSNESFKAYYEGKVNITKIAQEIIPYADPFCFPEFMEEVKDAPMEILCDAFINDIPGITPLNAPKELADFFYKIIQEAASAKRKQRTPNQKNSDDDEDNDEPSGDSENSKEKTVIHQQTNVVQNGKLFSSPAIPTGSPNVNQSGKTNLYVDNKEGGTVNMNIYPSKSEDIDNEMMMAIQSFSKEYYQLLVTTEDDVFMNNVITISKGRALEQNYVPHEIFERCHSLSDEGIAELKTFPAIICRENTEYNGITDENQLAVYGYIKHVQKDRNYNYIKVAFRPIKEFRQQILCDKANAVYFDLNPISDLNRSAWSVRKDNLFIAFKEAGIHVITPG